MLLTGVKESTSCKRLVGLSASLGSVKFCRPQALLCQPNTDHQAPQCSRSSAVQDCTGDVHLLADGRE